MTKGFFALISIFLPFLLMSNDIDIRLVNQSKLASEPGKVNNFLIAITNQGTKPAVLVPELSVPESWKVITDFRIIKLKPGQKTNKLISFIIPPKAVAGQYEIIYTLKDIHQVDKTNQGKFIFEVETTNKLEVIALEASSTAMAGKKIIGKFLVNNLSNQSQTIQLSTEKSIIIGGATIKLAPFSSRLIEVNTRTIAELRRESRWSFFLKAIIVGTEVSEIAFLHTQVIPTIDFQEDNRRKLPGFFSLNYLSREFSDGDKANGFQGELFLQGAIDKNEEKEITLSLRGPNQSDQSDLTLYDEYYATYKSHNLEVTIGDNNYSLSPLTEFSRNGRGMEASIDFEEVAIGAFYINPRFYPDLKRETGVYFQRKLNENNAVTFNYLIKEFSDIDKGTATLLSLSGRFAPMKNTTVEAEIASGNKGQAGYFNIRSKISNRLQFNTNIIYASPEFEGYFNNTLNIFGNLNYRLHKKVDVFAAVYRDDRNSALDTLLQTAPFTNRRQIGIRYKLDATSRFEITARQNEIEDRLPDKQFNRAEKLLTAQFNKDFYRFSFSLQSEYGQSRNFLQSTETDLQTVFRSYFDVNMKLGSFMLKGFGQYYNQSSLHLPEQKQLIWGVGIDGNIRSNTRFSLRYQNDFAIEEYYKNRNTFDFSFVQTIKKHHQIGLEVRQTLQRNTLGSKDKAVSLKYTWDFGIPLEKQAPKGYVYGQIERINDKPAKGIILFLNGKTAVTDENGKFRFKSMPLGKYPLLIDQSTLNLHEITKKETLPIVEILSETDQYVHLELVQSGTIHGAIEIKNNFPRTRLISYKNISNLLIEIKNGKEIRRTFTDDKGKFSFKDLRPGNWKYR